MSRLLDVRFAVDIFFFQDSAQAVTNMLHAQVYSLEQIGLKLKASNKKVLTTQVQPPSSVATPAALESQVLDETKSLKKNRGFLSMANTSNRQQDRNYRLQNASRARQGNRWRLCDKNMPIALRLKFFTAIVNIG